MRNSLLSLGLACTLGLSAAHAQTPTWQWAAQTVNPTPTNESEARAREIVTDAAGNSYVGVGLQPRNGAASVRNFGSTTLSSTATSTSAAVAKLNAAGQWQWATLISVQNANDPTDNPAIFMGDIVVTPAGDIFIEGPVDDKATSIRIGTVTLNLTPNTQEERMFVARLNSSGQCIWITAVNGASSSGMVLNPVNGELVLAGSYSGGSVAFGSTTLPAPAVLDDDALFVARLSQAGQWTSALGVRTVGNGDVTGEDIAIGSQGQVAVSVGVQAGSVTLGSTTINASSIDKMVVAQLSPAGQWQWVAQSSGSSSSLDLADIEYDSNGNVWVMNDDNAGGQIGSLTLPANTIGFVGRISTTGQWNLAGAVTSSNGGRFAGGNNMAVDAQGNPVLIGSAEGQTGTAYAYSFGTRALSFTDRGAFVARFNTNGTWQYAIKGPTATSPNGNPQYTFNSLALDQAGNLLVSGNVFASTIPFGSSTVVGSYRDMFVAKLTNAGATLGVRQAAGTQPLALYPNPVAAGTAATLRLASPATSPQPVTLRNALGQTVRQTSIAAGRQEAAVATDGLAPGVYLLEAGLSRAQVVVQ
ncbi:T9SS type A sorting domain-containing protein [Hymenobacter cellulosilyticus]|uniref:T9SS type A sorting domain-containing protein n=1 Tax=Hymenobacter cellulosilyticus TaxID=2932248 RepID=A0A8T9Q7Q1_9BACT|nr:T9SS type A sorting domain-containing protein [Hymenobacter cellulosilyticus]UOQ71810.1 T9SS type A sorting domain-containing protein [Hymenobacter cellulosilyticus]